MEKKQSSGKTAKRVKRNSENKRKGAFTAEFKKLQPKNFLLLLLAGCINAVGVTFFLTPVNLIDGGISGTSFVLSTLTGGAVPLSVFLLVLNLPFFIVGHKKMGISFTVYSIFAIAVYSCFAYLFQWLGRSYVGSPVVGNNIFLCSIFGGILSGVGSGLTIRFGGALDGIEVMAVLFHKKLGITVGTFVMIYNVIVFLFAGVMYAFICPQTLQEGVTAWELPLYSIVTYMVGIKSVDFVVEGLDKGKSAMIVTNLVDEVSSAVSEAFGRGITVLEGYGYYSQSEKKVLYVVCNRFELAKLKSLVLSIDPTAFIAISDISDQAGAKTQFRLKRKK